VRVIQQVFTHFFKKKWDYRCPIIQECGGLKDERKGGGPATGELGIQWGFPRVERHRIALTTVERGGRCLREIPLESKRNKR